MQGIKACYYLSCPVRMGLTGVTFSLVRRGASIHYPVSSELAAGTECCLSLQRLSVPFYVCHSLTGKNESMRTCTRAHHLIPPSCVHVHRPSGEAFAQYMYCSVWCALSPPSLSSLLFRHYLTRFPPSISSSEAPAFRGVSLLAGVFSR